MYSTVRLLRRSLGSRRAFSEVPLSCNWRERTSHLSCRSLTAHPRHIRQTLTATLPYSAVLHFEGEDVALELKITQGTFARHLQHVIILCFLCAVMIQCFLCAVMIRCMHDMSATIPERNPDAFAIHFPFIFATARSRQGQCTVTKSLQEYSSVH